MSKRFDDRLVLVTGAAGGMGRTIAQQFADEGATLLLTDINQAGLEETAALIAAQGATCSTHLVDLTDESDIQRFAAEVGREHTRLHVLVNNAGMAYGEVATGFAGLGQQKWLRFLAINSVAPLLLAEGLRAPLAAAPGVIVNMSSMASYMPATAYGVTKATLNAMTFGMAYGFAADGVRVNAVAPGVMDTPASKAFLPPEHYAAIQSQQLLPLHGTADDIAALVLFLASEDARFINCEIVHCDAGHRIRGWRG